MNFEYAGKELEYDEDGYVKSFGVPASLDEITKAQQFFEEFGFIVFNNVVTEEQLNGVKDDIFQNYLNGYNSEDIESEKHWTKAPWNRVYGGGYNEKHGFLGYSIAVSDAANNIRQNEDMHKIFSCILRDNRLWFTFDRYGFMRPTKDVQIVEDGKVVTKDIPEWKTSNSFIHWDLNPWVEQKFCRVQGIVAITDHTPTSGGFHCIPGFQKVIGDWANANLDRKDEHKILNNLNSPQLDHAIRKITMRKGSVCIWDSRLPHGNWPNNDDKFRIVFYLTYFPSFDHNEEIFSNRRSSVLRTFNERCFTNLGKMLAGILKNTLEAPAYFDDNYVDKNSRFNTSQWGIMRLFEEQELFREKQRIERGKKIKKIAPFLFSETNIDFIKTETTSKSLQKTWENILKKYKSEASELRVDNSIKDLIRKRGIPVHLRGKIWLAITNARNQSDSLSYFSLYETFKGKESPHTIQIEKDLLRTFPECSKFETEEGIAPLRRVLTTYSWINPVIGYCQSMNFICAILLLFMEEEDAFWLFKVTIEQILPTDYYTQEMTGIRADEHIFWELLSLKLPKLHSHFEKHDIILKGFITSWFLCVFIQTLPIQASLRVIDLLFVDGSDVLFKVALALFKINEKEILKTSTFEEVYNIVRSIGLSVSEPKRLIEVSSSIDLMNSSNRSVVCLMREKYIDILRMKDFETNQYLHVDDVDTETENDSHYIDNHSKHLVKNISEQLLKEKVELIPRSVSLATMEKQRVPPPVPRRNKIANTSLNNHHFLQSDQKSNSFPFISTQPSIHSKASSVPSGDVIMGVKKSYSDDHSSDSNDFSTLRNNNSNNDDDDEDDSKSTFDPRYGNRFRNLSIIMQSSPSIPPVPQRRKIPPRDKQNRKAMMISNEELRNIID